ncbi:MAG: hypothetical protein JXX14_25220 [Deltaproteobacteria bacterium]|nr:hypothetical protein [Deltaproteobacteria bacterium]
MKNLNGKHTQQSVKTANSFLFSIFAAGLWVFGCAASGAQNAANNASNAASDKTAAESTSATIDEGDAAAVDEKQAVPVEAESHKEILAETKIVHFQWSPAAESDESYSLIDEADQHRIVYPKGMEKGKAFPVVIAFHGQPKRGKDPRDYQFIASVQQQVLQMVSDGDIEPVILVIPVFRFSGTNWPEFDPRLFQEKVTELLAEEDVTPREWYAFGHSGAAGCGGNGLNDIHTINPKGVGFFDTCLGKEWQKEVKTLQKTGVTTFNIHSVETAGFRPKQRPEYQADFDFGRAYSPLGIEPVECPDVHPGDQLRTLPHRCSATEDGIVQSFVVDTGEGSEAHKAVLEPAITFFLMHFLGHSSKLISVY